MCDHSSHDGRIVLRDWRRLTPATHYRQCELCEVPIGASFPDVEMRWPCPRCGASQAVREWIGVSISGDE